MLVMSNHPLRPLRHRDVRLLWGASVFSDIGTWVQLVIIGSLVARQSGSALQTGLVALATFLPQGLSAPVGGLLADRYDRRKIFICGLIGQGTATSAVALALATGHRSPSTLIVVILCGSCFGALGSPAYSAMIPDLVPREELMQMVSLSILSWNAGRVVGPLFGTLLGATIGAGWSIAFNAATFYSMAVAVFLVRRPFPPSANADTGTVGERLATGWRVMRGTPGCFHSWYIVVLLNVAVAPFMGLIPIYARQVFGGGTALTGVFSMTQGVGALLGTMVTSIFAAKLGVSRVFQVIVPFTVLVYISWALAPNTAAAIVTVFFLGICASSVFVITQTVAQRDAPAEQRGRVMSINQASMGAGYGCGILIVGSLGDAISLRAAFGFATLIWVVGFGFLAYRSKTWRQALDGAPIHPEPAATLAVA
jgi:MFS family permease